MPSSLFFTFSEMFLLYLYLVVPALVLATLYVVVRLGVRHGIQDAEYRASREHRDASFDAPGNLSSTRR